MHTITALFDSYEAANRAVAKLRNSGFADDDISIVGRNESGTSGVRSATIDDDSATGAGTGATAGAALGGGAGLLAGLGMLAIPGLGPVVAAGWIAATLAGAVAGGAVGGIIGALTGAGVPEDAAHQYAEGIRRGGTLVTVRASEDKADMAARILDQEGTVDIDERSASWRREGWSGRFDDTTGASTSVPTSSSSGRRARIYPSTEGTDVELDDRRRRTDRDIGRRG